MVDSAFPEQPGIMDMDAVDEDNHEDDEEEDGEHQDQSCSEPLPKLGRSTSSGTQDIWALLSKDEDMLAAS